MRYATVRLLLVAAFGFVTLVFAWAAAGPGTPPWAVVFAVAFTSLMGFFVGHLVMACRLLDLMEERR